MLDDGDLHAAELFTEPVRLHSQRRLLDHRRLRYRGTASPALAGIYIFTDYCNGELRGLTTSDGGMTWDEQSLRPPTRSS